MLVGHLAGLHGPSWGAEDPAPHSLSLCTPASLSLSYLKASLNARARAAVRSFGTLQVQTLRHASQGLRGPAFQMAPMSPRKVQ